MFQALSTEHKVFLIAPRDNCSGMSAAISLRKEIEVEEVSENIFSVTGTPADCSYLGLLSVIQDPIEMIVSGINLGANEILVLPDNPMNPYWNDCDTGTTHIQLTPNTNKKYKL